MTIVALETTRPGGRMSEAEYDRERAAIPRTKAEAGIRWEQELAGLFYRSGWTVGELAKKEGRDDSYVHQLIRFGQFLSFLEKSVDADLITNACMTAGRFRNYWTRTDKREQNHNIRFREVARLMEAESGSWQRRGPSRKQPLSHNVGKAIAEKVSPGHWHSPTFMADSASVTKADALVFLDGMMRTSSKRTHHGVKVERKKVGKEYHYRIFKQDKTVSLDELREKLTPIIKALDAEGRKSVVTTIPHEVRCLAARLKKLLDEWAE